MGGVIALIDDANVVERILTHFSSKIEEAKAAYDELIELVE